MPTLNKNVKSYFDNHPKTDTWYFTPDETGVPFSEEGQAKSHCASLIKAGNKGARVICITRTDLKAWWPGQAKRDVVEATERLNAANEAYNKALEAKDALGPKAGIVSTTKAADVLNKAQAEQVKADSALQAAGKALYDCMFEAATEAVAVAKAGGTPSEITEAMGTLATLTKGGVAFALGDVTGANEAIAEEKGEEPVVKGDEPVVKGDEPVTA